MNLKLMSIDSNGIHLIKLKVQSNLDLVTNLVIQKSVTKSGVVTKFMVHANGV